MGARAVRAAECSQRSATAPNPNKVLQGAVLLVGGNLFAASGNLTAYRDAWLWRDSRWTKLSPPWNGPPVTWTNSGSPPAGPAPLLGLAAPLAAQCQILFLGESIATAGANPVVRSHTFAGGRDLTGDARPDYCVAANPTAAIPRASTPTAPLPAAELPRTGTTTVPLLALGTATLCAGLLIVCKKRRSLVLCRMLATTAARAASSVGHRR